MCRWGHCRSMFSRNFTSNCTEGSHRTEIWKASTETVGGGGYNAAYNGRGSDRTTNLAPVIRYCAPYPGYESWENVWGVWNGITPRDGQAIRIVGALLRFLGGRGYLHSPAWVPHSPVVNGEAVFASMWPLAAATSHGASPTSAPGTRSY